MHGLAWAPWCWAALAVQAAAIAPCPLLLVMIHIANWRQDGS